jgi:hypothetical protein
LSRTGRVSFEHKGERIILKDLPAEAPDKTAGITVLEMEFDQKPEQTFASYYPQLHRGREIAKDRI